MSDSMPPYEDFIRIFREEIDEHLPWQDAQQYYGVLTLESGWKHPASNVFQQMEQLRVSGKIPSPRFQRALTDFYWSYAY